ncbi:hypothetical protein J6590_077805 [Homalodisca vitripennis]|nr:hypothetical protein J6590_077805 [Homalodisca vitripennis]
MASNLQAPATNQLITSILLQCMDNGTSSSHHHVYTATPAPSHAIPKETSYAGQKLFNLLPAEMKVLTRKKQKKSLTEWLTSRPFYTLGIFKKKKPYISTL